MRSARKMIAATVLALAVLPIGGATYQSLASWRDARRSPEPGKLVTVGDHRLRIDCVGTGGPTVVLENGLGDILPEWEQVQTGIAKFARVCSYDRAGYGGSDTGPMPRTAAQIAVELHTLLQRSGEKPPYVLVGYSFGGYIVRVFTGKYPKEVAGVVLVDAPQEDEYRMFPLGLQKFSAALLQRYQEQARTAPWFVGLGIARLKLRREGGIGSYDYLILQSKYLKARASELQNMQVSADNARSSGSMGDKPLIVLTAGKTLGKTSMPGMSEQDVAEFERLWKEDLQVRLMHLSTRARQIVVQDATHSIVQERPGAIVEAVRAVCKGT